MTDWDDEMWWWNKMIRCGSWMRWWNTMIEYDEIRWLNAMIECD